MFINQEETTPEAVAPTKEESTEEVEGGDTNDTETSEEAPKEE